MINYVRKHPEVTTADVAASFQEAVVDVLVDKTRRAAADVGPGGSASAVGWPPTRPCGRRSQTACAPTGIGGLRAEPGHVHRQRGHGRGRRPGTGSRRTADARSTPGADPNLRLPLG